MSKIQEFLSKTFCQVLKPSGAHKKKWNGPIVAKLKGIFALILSSMRIAFMIKINFNSTVIWSQFILNVSVFFLLKNVLVPSTIHVRGLHVQTKIIISTCPGKSDRGVGAPCISISLWALNSKFLVKRYHYQTY